MSNQRAFSLNNINAAGQPALIFWDELAKGKYPFTIADDWSIEWTHNPLPEELVFDGLKLLARGYISHHSGDYTMKGGGLLVRVVYSPGWVYFYGAGKDERKLSALYDAFKKRHPTPVTTSDQISVNFWYLGGNGPASIHRQLEASDWNDIKLNYPAEVASELTRLVEPNWRPQHGGQLLLWQGPPGGGKTYAIRSFVKEIAPWCRCSFVTDVDRFFNESGYMMHVLLSEAQADKWKLIILEDAGELIAQNAKQTTGQALSRLLNVADGLLGQGLKVMLLITTNEEMNQLHAAVSRPGRCASKLNFRDFTVEEAQAWMTREGVTKPLPKQRSLAELYALKDGLSSPANSMPPKRQMGFALPQRRVNPEEVPNPEEATNPEREVLPEEATNPEQEVLNPEALDQSG